MGYVTPEQIARAKELDLLTYLQRYDPNQLIHVGGSAWCTREHDSLKISNGKWHWFSRGIGGRSALDYLIKVKSFHFTRAVEELSERAAETPPISYVQKTKPAGEFVLPELNGNTDAVVKYLTGRGIHPDILDYCLSHKLLFETRKYHNALFAGYDGMGTMRYAALRGTAGDFKGEVCDSDKRYSFVISENPSADSVHLFESAIDLLSFATLMKMKGRDWRQDDLLSLGGVCRSRREATLPAALGQYLREHPSTGTVFLHLDNDEAGRIAAEDITRCLAGRCEVVVATHCNTGHYHTHFVINSVSWADGYKFYNSPADYAKMREASDRLCREYGLSVIEHPKGKAKSYAEWQAERDGKPTQRSIIRADIDRAIRASTTERDFICVMTEMGYELKTRCKDGEPLKYPALKPLEFLIRFKLGINIRQ